MNHYQRESWQQMIKRYPHAAIVTIEADGHLVNGEWVPGKPVEISVLGRYGPMSDGRIVLKHNSTGDETQIYGYFYSKTRPPANNEFLRLKVTSKGIDVPVVYWESYQSHSIINV